MIDSMLNWDQKFYELRGYPLNAVVGLMGLPDNQYQLGDSKVYIWRNTSSTMYSAGKRKSGESALEYLARAPSITMSCEVKMVVASNNIISRVEVNGSQNPCTPSKWDW